ncbi:MAG: VRR-NUC domain-containing protein, partial [Patescibacteria group bacterium]|nr:VRR-NUC domain-containing protein [Patescibacteria group bacterium]
GNVEPVADLGNPLERDVLAAVLAALRLHPKVALAYRMNTGGMQDAHGNHVRFGFPGSPDIHGMLKNGRALYVECKRRDTKPTPDQQAFLDRVNRHGGLAFVARSIDDVLLALDDKGVA